MADSGSDFTLNTPSSSFTDEYDDPHKDGDLDLDLDRSKWEWTFTHDWPQDSHSWLTLPGKNRIWYAIAEWNHKKVTEGNNVWVNVSGKNGASHKYLDEVVCYY